MNSISEKEVRKLTRRLADVEKEVRDAAFDELRGILCTHTLPPLDLKRLMLGLFYCVWHSDKALVQNALCEDIAAILLDLSLERALPFFSEFFSILGKEWSLLDQHRLDKYLYLIRCLIRSMLNKCETSETVADSFASLLKSLMICEKTIPYGFQCQICDVFPDELFRVFTNSPPPNIAFPFIEVIISCFCKTINKFLRKIYNNCILLITETLTNEYKENPSDKLSCLLGSLRETISYNATSSSAGVIPIVRPLLHEINDVIEATIRAVPGQLTKVSSAKVSIKSEDDEDIFSSESDSEPGVLLRPRPLSDEEKEEIEEEEVREEQKKEQKNRNKRGKKDKKVEFAEIQDEKEVVKVGKKKEKTGKVDLFAFEPELQNITKELEPITPRRSKRNLKNNEDFIENEIVKTPSKRRQNSSTPIKKRK
ncbi:hypothetical protein RCL1_001192 [Eukaryota sp. TZLM3-RCL]